LAAQHDLGPTTRRSAVDFLERSQRADGGWSDEPPTAGASTPTDPDSTALVIQALIAARVSPASPPFARASVSPLQALLSFRVRSGGGAGAFFFPPKPAPADLIATYQAIPALMGRTISQIRSSGSHRLGVST